MCLSAVGDEQAPDTLIACDERLCSMDKILAKTLICAFAFADSASRRCGHVDACGRFEKGAEIVQNGSHRKSGLALSFIFAPFPPSLALVRRRMQPPTIVEGPLRRGCLRSSLWYRIRACYWLRFYIGLLLNVRDFLGFPPRVACIQSGRCGCGEREI